MSSPQFNFMLEFYMNVLVKAQAVTLTLAMFLVFPGCGKQDDLPVPVQTTKLRLNGGEVSLVPHLAMALGEFEKEGLDVTLVPSSEIKPHSYMMQKALHDGVIDASVHWFQHTLYGAGNGTPVKAVMLLNDAPGLTVMVANRVKDEIRSGADFEGRNVAEGMGYATKSILTNYLVTREGLPLGSYTPVMSEVDRRLEAVLKGLENDEVDVMSFMEPMTTALLQSGMTSVLYDLTSAQSTANILGAAWPAQSVFVTPEFASARPEVTQKLVNALVRTMTFIHSNSADDIIAALPDSYFTHKDRAMEADRIRKNLSTYAKTYAFPLDAVELAIKSTQAALFDDTEEGIFRARCKNIQVAPDDLYTNVFVEHALTKESSNSR